MGSRFCWRAHHTTPRASGKPEQPAEPSSKKPSQPESLSADLPPAWKEITRLDPTKYPDADGLLLRRRLSYTLGSNPAIAADHEEFIQILTAEGKRFGDF